MHRPLLLKAESKVQILPKHNPFVSQQQPGDNSVQVITQHRVTEENVARFGAVG